MAQNVKVYSKFVVGVAMCFRHWLYVYVAYINQKQWRFTNFILK